MKPARDRYFKGPWLVSLLEPRGMEASKKGHKKNPAAAREWRRRVGVVDCVPEWDERPKQLDSAADERQSGGRSVLVRTIPLQERATTILEI